MFANKNSIHGLKQISIAFIAGRPIALIRKLRRIGHVDGKWERRNTFRDWRQSLLVKEHLEDQKGNTRE